MFSRETFWGEAPPGGVSHGFRADTTSWPSPFRLQFAKMLMRGSRPVKAISCRRFSRSQRTRLPYKHIATFAPATELTELQIAALQTALTHPISITTRV